MLSGWQGGSIPAELNVGFVTYGPDTNRHDTLLEYKINSMHASGDGHIGTVNLTLEGLPQKQVHVSMARDHGKWSALLT